VTAIVTVQASSKHYSDSREIMADFSTGIILKTLQEVGSFRGRSWLYTRNINGDNLLSD